MNNRLLSATIAILTLPLVGGVGALELSLDEAVELARGVDRRIEEAAATVEAARAARLAAWGSYTPVIALSAGLLRNWSGPSTMTFEDPFSGDELEFASPEEVENRATLGAQANLYLYRGGANYEGIAAADAATAAARANAAALADQVVFETRSAYVELYRARSRLESAERSLTSAREQLRFAERLTEVGSLPQSDALKSRAAVDSAELAVIQAANSVESARTNLAFLCGLNLDEPIEIEIPQPEPLTTDLTEALTLADDTPELLAARAAVEEAAANHRAALAGYLPQAYLQGSYSWSEQTPLEEGALDEGYNFTLGAYLSWSLFDGFASNAQRSSTNLARLRARLAERDVDRSLELSLRLALNDLEAARLSVEVAELSHARAVDDLELARRKLELGSGTLRAALEAEANLSAAERSLTDARAGYAIACYQLNRLLGDDEE